MNFVEIMGHLGADPEMRYTPNGQKVVSLRIATNSRKAGKDITTWWKATIWGDRYDKMLPYLKKGSGVIIMGELQKPEIYTDKNGVSQVSLEVTVEILRFNPFGKPQEGQANNADPMIGSEASRPAKSNNPFTGNPQEDLGSSDLEYPSMDYPSFSQQPTRGQNTNQSGFTHDNIPF